MRVVPASCLHQIGSRDGEIKMPTEFVGRTRVYLGISVGVGREIDDADPGESTQIVASVHQRNAHVERAFVVVKGAVDIVSRGAGKRKGMPGYLLIDGAFDPRVVCLHAKAIQWFREALKRLIESDFGAVGLTVGNVLRG